MEIRPYNVKIDHEGQSFGFYFKDHPFSNCHPLPIEVDGVVYPSVEHAYQILKLDPTDDENSNLISEYWAEPDPEVVAKKAHTSKVKPIEGWGEMKIDVMDKLIRAKVAQHPKMQRLLLKSKGWILYEDAPEDTFWGTANGIGENWNGQILMQIREELLFERNYADAGLVNYDQKTHDTLVVTLGLQDSADVSWYDIYSTIVKRRAELNGFDTEGLHSWQILQLLERQFQTEATKHPVFGKGIKKVMSYDEKWKKISENYQEFYHGLSDDDKALEDLRRKTAAFLELNKFAATWEMINEELARLGIEAQV